ncbi:MAG: universal stress protein [Acidobacteriaceae bacterium]
MHQEIQFKQILVATDFLASSRVALDYAVAFAIHFKASIVILHVVELMPAAMEAEVITKSYSQTRQAEYDRLAALVDGVRKTGVNVSMLVKNGVPSDVILQVVKQTQTDLLVLGIHGVDRGLDHLLVGSNAEKLLLSAPCPTLIVGAHVASGVDRSHPMKKILYCSDFTPEAAGAAPYVAFLRDEFSVPIEFYQLLPEAAVKNRYLAQNLAAQYCNTMKSFVGDKEAEWCSPEFQLKNGLGQEQMIERAQQEMSGLIVLGVRSESSLKRHFHTCLAYHLLAKAASPVLSIRSINANT